MLRAIVSVLVVTACSSGTTGRTRPLGHGSAHEVPISTAAPPSEHECEELIAHAVAIKVAEQRETLPPDQVPTETDQAALRTELRGTFLEACRESSRESYQCAIAASTLAELEACQSTTRSNSTSNNSVAPGGITPPAPRSP